MNSAMTRIGGALAACVAKVGLGAVLTNPVTWVVGGVALAAAAISDAAKKS